MSLSRIAGAAVLSALLANVAPSVEGAQTPTNINIDRVNLTNNTVSGTIAGAPFTTRILSRQLSLLPGNGRRCSVLHLQLEPISIRLVGLHVDTSPICLDITAFQGKGLLGDLLCGLADGGLVLGNVITQVEGLLADVLNESLGQTRGNDNGGRPSDTVCTGECEVLDLVLGPLTLNLLGVQVKLDDCNNGPVEVCISATASEGLLGQLLCDLAGGLPLSLGDLLDQVTGLIEDYLATL